MLLRFLVTLILVAVLTYFYMRIVRGIDRYEKEPLRYLFVAFLWGAVPAIVVAIVVELVLDVPISFVLGDESLGGQIASTAVIAPAVEEILKAAVVAMLFVWRKREFDGWVDGIVYGSTAGFGFAFVENVFYLLGPETWEGWAGLFFLRVVVFGLMHGFWTALTGIGFGVARNMQGSGRRVLVVLIGLSAAIASHMLHNGALVLASTSGGSTLLLAGINYLALVIVLLILSFVAGRGDRTMMKTYLRDEVPEILSPAAYEGLCNTRNHTLARLYLAPRQRRAFIQTAAELAQKKRQLIRMGNESGNAVEIERLRAQLATYAR
jgi:protease PrsW